MHNRHVSKSPVVIDPPKTKKPQQPLKNRKTTTTTTPKRRVITIPTSSTTPPLTTTTITSQYKHHQTHFMNTSSLRKKQSPHHHHINTLIQNQFSTEAGGNPYRFATPHSPLTPEELAKRNAPLVQKSTEQSRVNAKQMKKFDDLYQLQQSLDDTKGNQMNPFGDPKSPHFVPGPKIDDDANPYSLATRHDNEEYARQTTILNKFQTSLGELNGFVDPFMDKTKVREPLPTTIGEMNSMLSHAILKENNYELGWVRFGKMINSVPDYLKSWLEQSLFDQFNTPMLFRRDADVGATEDKVMFSPDQRSYQLIIVACLQAFEEIKQKYHPGMVDAALRLVKYASIANSQNDDDCESQATMLYRTLEEVKREITRRKTLPLEEQERLLSLENGGLGYVNLPGINNNHLVESIGLHHAMSNLRATDLEGTNRLEYNKLGITEYELETQKSEKMLALGKTIVDMTGPLNPNDHDNVGGGSNPLKYKATRKIPGDDSDDNDDGAVEVIGTTNDNGADGGKKLVQHNYGQPILTARKHPNGTLIYKLSLPQLPFGLIEGPEFEYWENKLKTIAGMSQETSQELQELRTQMLSDPFSEPYHCLQQVTTWNSRINFVLRDIMEHYYSTIHRQSPQLYQLLRSTDECPPPNYSGVDGFTNSIGYSTQMLDTVIKTAEDQDLLHIWLEASTLKSKLTPAPLHVPTVAERRMIIRENFIKEAVFADILASVPTSNDPLDQIESQKVVTTATTTPLPPPIPKLSIPQFMRCMKLFQDYGTQVSSYIKAVQNYDNSFLGEIEAGTINEYFTKNRPRKLTHADLNEDDIRELNHIKSKRDAEGELHAKIRELNLGEIDFKTSYISLESQPNKPLSSLTPEQLHEYKSRRPQPLQEMIGMDRLVGETIRRYPLLAAFAPQQCSHYKSMETIITTRYGGIDKLPMGLRTGVKLDEKTFPKVHMDVDIRNFGFTSTEQLLQYPYPPHIKQQIDDVSVSMVKTPVFNAILTPPSDVEVGNERKNYQHLMLSPSASFVPLEDAIKFVNKFTQMGKYVQTQELEFGEVEEVNEFAYQIDYQTFLQQKYQQMVKISQIQNNSINIRNMSRLGMYYIDTIIISWAAQQGLKLPELYTREVQESYSSLTNDIFNQALNVQTNSAVESLESEIGLDQITPQEKKLRQEQQQKQKQPLTHESKSLQHDLHLVNPPRTRLQQWQDRMKSDNITNPTKFFSLSIDERVALIDSAHESSKLSNTFAQFFNSDPNTPLSDPDNRYHLLRSYIRFAMRAGDEDSLKKALILYRSTTKLLEYVQRRTNEDVYIQGGEKMFEEVTNEEEFNKVSEQLEKQKARQHQIEEEIPAAMRADMTKDDIRKSTGGMGEKTKMWNEWYGADAPESMTSSDPLHKTLANDPRSQGDGNDEHEMDNLVQQSGMLDDYADRINALLTAKHGKKKNNNNNNTNNDESNTTKTPTLKRGPIDAVEQTGIADEKDIEFYKQMVSKNKSKKLGDLFVPGYDDSDEEQSGNDDAKDDNEDLKLAQTHFDKDVELEGGTSNRTKSQSPPRTYSSAISQQGRMTPNINKNDNNDDNNDDDDDNDPNSPANKEAAKHAPHTRLVKLASASHVKFDYMLTQMVINLHQFLIRNETPLHRTGLPSDVQSKRFSDEVTAHWALARRNLYDQRIALIHSFDEKINPATGEEYSSSEQRERQKEKAKTAVKMLKKNRQQDTLAQFEREAGQIAIMTLDTLILDGFVPVAKITAKQAYDDGLLTKEFIESFFEQHGPELEASPEEIMAKELGLDKMMGAP